jgi:hypothetical protein
MIRSQDPRIPIIPQIPFQESVTVTSLCQERGYNDLQWCLWVPFVLRFLWFLSSECDDSNRVLWIMWPLWSRLPFWSFTNAYDPSGPGNPYHLSSLKSQRSPWSFSFLRKTQWFPQFIWNLFSSMISMMPSLARNYAPYNLNYPMIPTFGSTRVKRTFTGIMSMIELTRGLVG